MFRCAAVGRAVTPRCVRCGRDDATGHIDPGVHDGVIAWVCPCGHAWPRFYPPHHLADAARRAVRAATPQHDPAPRRRFR